MNKIKFKNYKIIKELNMENMEKEVNKYLKKGYILIGGTSNILAYGRFWYIQTIAQKVNFKNYKKEEYEFWYDQDELEKFGYKTFEEYILDKNETRFNSEIILEAFKNGENLKFKNKEI